MSQASMWPLHPIFGRFLFIRFEDIMRMKAPALIRLLSNFTGLYTDSDIIFMRA